MSRESVAQVKFVLTVNLWQILVLCWVPTWYKLSAKPHFIVYFYTSLHRYTLLTTPARNHHIIRFYFSRNCEVQDRYIEGTLAEQDLGHASPKRDG